MEAMSSPLRLLIVESIQVLDKRLDLLGLVF
jgi:hypothetical protein